VNSLRTSGDVIHLLICDGYDAAEVERLQSEGVLTREAKSTSESVSSLDRIGEEPNHDMIKVIHILICWNFLR
jgi:protein scribble